MSSDSSVRRERIGRLLSEIVWPATHPRSAPLSISISRLPGEPVPPELADTLAFSPFRVGETWGGAWSTAWFRAVGETPDEFEGSHVVARLDLGYRGQTGFGGEALLFDGPTPRQGLNPKHNTIEITSSAVPGERVELLVEAAANPAQQEGPLEWPLLMPDYDGPQLYRLRRFDLAVEDDEMMAVLFDWTVLVELADSLGHTHRRSIEILRLLDDVARGVDLSDLRRSVVAHRERWQELLEIPTSPQAHQVTAVGHAHIDSAWLWPVRETRRKCARTFATAIRMMEQDPAYVFVCSQAQQHAWMEQHYPTLFEQMKRHVAGGQLEPVGSMWVEPDTNLPSGESLARQLVFGKRFFLDRYGVETVDCWLPDAFGYSGALPQILTAAGVRRFFTQKLSWNETNAFPHHTFWWEGIDGSRVLAHCPPTDTYNGEFAVAQLLEGERRFAQHGVSSRSLYVYGYGDGGGGPTTEMLERARRVGDLDPLPAVRLGTSRSFFDALEAEAEASDRAADEAAPGTVRTSHAPGPGGLPIWSGELYLERHRGVQTTQARGKLGNRRSEGLLREAEFLVAAALAGGEADVAMDELAGAWQSVLLLQFHDILPGSSIHWVHDDAELVYGEVADVANDVIGRAADRLVRKIGPVAGGSGGLGSAVVVNAATRERHEVVEVDVAGLGLGGMPRSAIGPDGAVLPVQPASNGNVLVAARVPGCGFARYELSSEPATADLAHGVEIAGRRISNGLVSVTIDEDGLIGSVEDLLRGREAIEPGEQANVFQLHHDLPNHFDAWDVDPGTFDRAVEERRAASVEVLEEGPLRVSLRVTRPLGGSSRVVQDVRVCAGSSLVELETEVDWQERHRFLKVAFPLALRAPHASYEIQFGHLERPTHANTSWDAARFEVPAQRWASLNEPGFGVALINDCKYGYDVRRNVMRLSLLRGPGWPDPEADFGTHRFRYALYCHERLDEVASEAEAFNLPLRVVAGGRAAAGAGEPAAGALVRLEGASLSAVKLADDASGDLVVRFYEHAGAHGHAVLVADGVVEASRVDLLERPLGELAVDGGRLRVPLRPFELVTARLRRR